jgi:hypothetical protein
MYKPWSSVDHGYARPPERPAKLRTPQERYVCRQVMAIGTMASWSSPPSAMAAHRVLGRTYGQRLPGLICWSRVAAPSAKSDRRGVARDNYRSEPARWQREAAEQVQTVARRAASTPWNVDELQAFTRR